MVFSTGGCGLLILLQNCRFRPVRDHLSMAPVAFSLGALYIAKH